MLSMRTTVTLDSDVERVIRDEIHRSRKSFKEVLNEAVRSALKPSVKNIPKLLPARELGLRTGFDPRELSDVADELEAEAFLKMAIQGRNSRT